MVTATIVTHYGKNQEENLHAARCYNPLPELVFALCPFYLITTWSYRHLLKGCVSLISKTSQ